MSYFFLWIWVSAFAVLLEDVLRTKLFGEAARSYRLI
jgi:hypothetical protein